MARPEDGRAHKGGAPSSAAAERRAGAPGLVQEGRPGAPLPRTRPGLGGQARSWPGLLQRRDSTRGVYEKRLQQFLSSHSPARPSGPEFSASEEEEEEGTPLQDAPVSRLGRVSGPNSSRRGEGGALYSPGRSRGGGKEDVPVVSRTSTTFTMAGTPARGTLRARAGNTGSPLSTMMAKASNSSRRDVQGQARKARGAEQAVVSGSSSGPSRGGLSPGAQVAAVVLLVAACLLVYANLEYFKADVPVPSVVHP
ncbi:uncharacterized protein LOC144151501 isoform X3 [Haemaphysalis longicornis]